jgi:exopolyphosphatase/guanosine-5'-triphosphate,3'-diphosphate pyrophosphatase
LSRYAAIDIGSNSVLLLIIEAQSGGHVKVISEAKKTLRLAERIDSKDGMDQAAVSVLMSVLDSYMQAIKEAGAERVTAVATQLFRTAVNGQEIAAKLYRRYDWPVNVLDGEEEARLSYLAAATGISGIRDERVVIDVGGGSTEVVYGVGPQVQYVRSFPIGAVALSHRFSLSEQIEAQNYERAVASVAEVVGDEELPRLPGGCQCILVGGSAITMAAINEEVKEFNPEGLHGVELTTKWLRREALEIAEMSAERREILMFFDPERAEIIVGGCAIIQHLLEQLRFERITVSNRGLRWGLLVDRFGLVL